MPKIAIDARKWRDYGIGTYVRNLVRHLAHLDRETTYFLFCDPADEATLRDLAENFVPVVDSSRGYRLQEHVSIPLKLRRLGVDLLHSPHYVLPLLCRRRAVVTIHDCIHLLFPEYLPNRMALTYAQRMMGHAIAHSSLVFTVSEASRRDILRFYPSADPERVQVVPNAIDAAILERSGRGGDGARPGALPDPRALRPLRREHQAPQEPRAADPTPSGCSSSAPATRTSSC